MKFQKARRTAVIRPERIKKIILVFPKKKRKSPCQDSPGLLPYVSRNSDSSLLLFQTEIRAIKPRLININPEADLHREIHMLDRSYLACFLEVDACLANCSL